MVIYEIVKKSILKFDHIYGIGLRVDISGGNGDTGLFYSDMIVSGTKSFTISSFEDLNKHDFSYLVGQTIISAETNFECDLEIKLSGGDVLIFPHSEEVEAWEIRWLKGKLYICMIGGEDVMVFQGDFDERLDVIKIYNESLPSSLSHLKVKSTSDFLKIDFSNLLQLRDFFMSHTNSQLKSVRKESMTYSEEILSIIDFAMKDITK